MKNNHLLTVLFVILISSCTGGGGGGGGSETSSPPPGQILKDLGSSVTIVDPYIQGATMCYDENENDSCDNHEAESTPSDIKGFTKFDITLPEGAKLIQKEKGFSLGKPFLGTLKTKFDPAFNFVTPITTLIANGVSEDDLVEAIKEVPGNDNLTIGDLLVNPMSAIENEEASKLVALKASMAITALLVKNPDLSDLSDDSGNDLKTKLKEKYENINQVVGDKVPDSTTLKAAVVVQEYISSKDTIEISEELITNLKTQITNGGSKEIKLEDNGDGAIGVKAFDVPAPNIVRTLNNFNLFNTSPKIFVGGIKSGDEVQLYSDDTCSSVVGESAISQGQSILLSLPEDLEEDINKIYAKILIPEGETAQTACSSAFASFKIDKELPTIPSIENISILEDSPSNSASLEMTFDSGSNSEFIQYDDYKLFKDASCTELVSSKMIGTNDTNSFLISTNLTHGIYHFYLQAKDLAGNQTDCIDLEKTHEVDLVAPHKPASIVKTSPEGSPVKDRNLSLKISGVEIGSTVQLFVGSSCLQAEESLEKASAQTDEVSFSLPDLADGEYKFSTNIVDEAGNISPCLSGDFTHIIDNEAPATPEIELVIPVTPIGNSRLLSIGANNVSPTDTIKIFDDANCTTQLASASAIGNSIVINLSLPDDGADGEYLFYAHSTDLAGNSSSCSAAVSYQLDTKKPEITSVAFLTSNSSQEYAKAGETIEISFETSEKIDLSKSKLKFAGRAFSLIDISTQDEDQYKSTINVQQNDPEGLVNVEIEFYDFAENLLEDNLAALETKIDLTAPSKPDFSKVYPSKAIQATDYIDIEVVNIDLDGNKITFYKDSSCTAELSDTSLSDAVLEYQLALPEVALYRIYSKLEDKAGNISECYDTGIEYEYSRSVAEGIASMGTPMQYAKITVIGKDGPCEEKTRADHEGKFNFVNLNSCSGPYLFKAQNVFATYFAIAAEEDLASGIKINPITEFISLRAYNKNQTSFRDWIGHTNPFEGISNKEMFDALEAEQAVVSTYFSALSSQINLTQSDLRFMAGENFENMLEILDVEQQFANANPQQNDEKFVFSIKGSSISSDAPIRGELTEFSLPVDSSRGLLDHLGEISHIKTTFSAFNNCLVITDINKPSWIDQATEEVDASAIETCLEGVSDSVDFKFMGSDLTGYAEGIAIDDLSGFNYQYSTPTLADFNINENVLEVNLLTQEIFTTSTSDKFFPGTSINLVLRKTNDGDWKIIGDTTDIDFDLYPVNYMQNLASEGLRGFSTNMYDYDNPENRDVFMGITFENLPLNPAYNIVYQMFEQDEYNGYGDLLVEKSDGEAANSVSNCNSSKCRSFLEIPSELKRMNQILKITLTDQDNASYTIFRPAPTTEILQDEFPSIKYKIGDEPESDVLSAEFFDQCRLPVDITGFNDPEEKTEEYQDENGQTSTHTYYVANSPTPYGSIIISHPDDHVLPESDIGNASSKSAEEYGGLSLYPDYEKLKQFNILDFYNNNVAQQGIYKIERDLHYLVWYPQNHEFLTNDEATNPSSVMNFEFFEHEINQVSVDRGGIHYINTHSCSSVTKVIP